MTPEFGGQGLPWLDVFPHSGNVATSSKPGFGLCPLLNQGAVEAITTHGTQDQKRFLSAAPNPGEWTGTMNLTEPGQGLIRQMIRSKAERTGDGTYLISGQKIFITYGDHDMSDNIIHLNWRVCRMLLKV